MVPLIQATFAGAQAAAAASVKQKQPLTRSEQLDEANKAAMVVADRCDMTEDERELIDEATIAAKEAASVDEQSAIATCFAVALACRLSLTEEAQSAVTGSRWSGCKDWQRAACASFFVPCRWCNCNGCRPSLDMH